jgi:hypothetical protein
MKTVFLFIFMGLFTMVGFGQEHDSSYKYIKIAAPWVKYTKKEKQILHFVDAAFAPDSVVTKKEKRFAKRIWDMVMSGPTVIVYVDFYLEDNYPTTSVSSGKYPHETSVPTAFRDWNGFSDEKPPVDVIGDYIYINVSNPPAKTKTFITVNMKDKIVTFETFPENK